MEKVSVYWALKMHGHSFVILWGQVASPWSGVLLRSPLRKVNHDFSLKDGQPIASLMDVESALSQRHESQLLDILYSSISKLRPVEPLRAKTQEALHARCTTGYTSR